MDSRNFAIGALSTIATILFVGLLVINTRPDVAVASGMTAQAGSYQLVVGTDATADQELLYIFNNALGRMITYRFNPNNNQIEILNGVDLSKLTSPPKQQKRRRGRRP